MVNMSRGEYLRCAALYELPPSIPAVNREAWRDLGKTLANLNQLVVLMRQHGYDERISDHAITQLLKEVRALRIRLVKAREESGDESEN